MSINPLQDFAVFRRDNTTYNYCDHCKSETMSEPELIILDQKLSQTAVVPVIYQYCERCHRARFLDCRSLQEQRR